MAATDTAGWVREHDRVVGQPLRGTLDEHVLVSEALRGNPLGDPHERPLWVYTPPTTAAPPYVLQGFTGRLDMWRNRAAFRPTFLELLDDADVDARVVFVDAWTSVGGSQFVDLRQRPLPHLPLRRGRSFVDERYETNGRRGVAGKSSGGYGAMVTAMLRPDLFHGVASHAGGGLFDVSIRPFLAAARRLRDAHGGSMERFLEELRTGLARRSRTRTTSTSCSSGASRPRTPRTRTGRFASRTISRRRR